MAWIKAPKHHCIWYFLQVKWYWKLALVSNFQSWGHFSFKFFVSNPYKKAKMDQPENELDATTSHELYFNIRQNTSLKIVLWPFLDLYFWMKAKIWKSKLACFGFCKVLLFGVKNEKFSSFSKFQIFFPEIFFYVPRQYYTQRTGFLL